MTHRLRLALAWLAGTGTIAAGIGLLGTAAYLILRAARFPPILDLTVAIVGVRFFGISRAALRYVERLSGHDAALRTAADLRRRAAAALERLTPGGIDRDRSADLLDRVTRDVEEAQQSLVRTTLPPAVAAAAATGAAVLCWWIAPAAGAALGLGAATTGALAWTAVVAADRFRSRRVRATHADLTALAVDLIDGAEEALVYGRSGDLLERAEAADAAVLRSERAAAWATGLGAAVVAFGTGLTLWMVLRAGIAASGDGGLDTILPGVMAVVALAAFEPVALLPRAAAGAAPARAARRRLAELAARPDPVAAPPDPVPLPASPALRLEGAWVRAGSGWVLRDVDLHVEPGRAIAVVGPSGAGKTTLAETLLRFRPLDRGRYVVGGRDAETLDPREVRTIVGLAAEDAHLVDGSVLDNLRVADPSVGRERAEDALRSVGLQSWLARLDAGLDTRVGERGTAVSGGERRRIALARALLFGFPVLIVDEPTAGLDPESAQRVVAEVLDASSGRGVVLITHGIEGLEEVDEIVVLADGRVAERGTHAELIAAAGPYASLRAGSRRNESPGDHRAGR